MPLATGISEERLIAEFFELVQIDSPVFEEGELAKLLTDKLIRLGFSVSNDGTGQSTGNLIARLPGTAPNGTTLALNAHMDTVEPGRGIVPIIHEGIVRSSGTTILGADNKASLAAILEAVRFLLESQMPRPDLELLITHGEEFGLVGSSKLDVSPLHARLCCTLDALAPIGTIVISAPIHYSFRATFKGRAAHAGAEPEEGINALVAACRAVARMTLGRIDAETTANVGLMHGGSARNSVPAVAELEGETRSLKDPKAAKHMDTMAMIMEEEAKNIGVSLDLQTKLDYPSYCFNPDDFPIRAARKALERIGVAVSLTSSGGGSDANHLNKKGLPTVVLGSGVVAAHTVDEHIAVSDVMLLAELVVSLVTLAAEGLTA